MVVKDTRIELKPKKLINRKTNCFFNAVMQCLLSIPSLTTFYYETRFNKNQKFSVLFKDFIKDYNENEVIDPESIIKGLKGKINVLNGGEQDSHEFLILFLGFLILELSGKYSDVIKSVEELDNYKKGNALANIFVGLQKYSLRCSSCNSVSDSFQHFSCITLNFSENIKDSLDLYSKETTLEGKNGWDCYKCKKKRNAYKKVEIIAYPNVLIINLLRFIDDKTKDARKVRLNETLKFGNIKYKIFGFVSHRGSVNTGHYISYAIRENIWYRFDDSNVSRCENVDLDATDAYVVFYTLS